uniref:Uncharacterized protein n=1 Tax=Parascaris univalens TaxID=6257 RepID=A0A914ZNE1_PARUN
MGAPHGSGKVKVGDRNAALLALVCLRAAKLDCAIFDTVLARFLRRDNGNMDFDLHAHRDAAALNFGYVETLRDTNGRRTQNCDKTLIVHLREFPERDGIYVSKGGGKGDTRRTQESKAALEAAALEQGGGHEGSVIGEHRSSSAHRYDEISSSRDTRNGGDRGCRSCGWQIAEVLLVIATIEMTGDRRRY